MVQMLQIGEETGEVGNILERLAKFYNREVNAAVDTLVSLIEPVLQHHTWLWMHRSACCVSAISNTAVCI